MAAVAAVAAVTERAVAALQRHRHQLHAATDGWGRALWGCGPAFSIQLDFDFDVNK